MEIRSATPPDAPAIADILNALLTTTTVEWTETPHRVEDIVRWIEDHEVVLVAEEDGEVVGLAAFGWFRDAVVRPGYRFTVENSVHVRQSHWGRGLGSRLMQELIEAARASGKHAMVAAIDATNEDSIRFHQRLGFAEVGRLPQVGTKFGRWLDLVLLELRLDERAEPPS
ncbi:MAG TPA: GNAT family N-acetyltransferase [Acidimicrobiales bacterium]|jgi:phosphinothricin acetyltransferase